MRARIVRTKGQTSSPARGFNFQVKMYNRRTRSTSCVTRDFGLCINVQRMSDCTDRPAPHRLRVLPPDEPAKRVKINTHHYGPNADRPPNPTVRLRSHAADSSNLKALVALAPQRRRVIETDNVIL